MTRKNRTSFVSRLTAEQRETLLRLSRDGVPHKEIGRLVGICPSEVCRLSLLAGIRRREPRQFPVAEAIRLYREGKTIRAIGAALGWSHSNVRRYLVGYKVPLRKRGSRPTVPSEHLYYAHLEGLSYASIGVKFGLNTSSVHRRVQRHLKRRASAAP